MAVAAVLVAMVEEGGLAVGTAEVDMAVVAAAMVEEEATATMTDAVADEVWFHASITIYILVPYVHVGSCYHSYSVWRLIILQMSVCSVVGAL